MDAVVDIKISVHSRKRMWDEPFKPTRTYTSSWHWPTTLSAYALLTPTIADEIVGYIASERAQVAETTTHVSIRLDNPTHPITGKGVIPLAKGHMDTAYTEAEITSTQFLITEIDKIISHLKAGAKY